MRPTPHTRSDYAVFVPVPLRWNDNDTYGHVNNAVYYELFDTAVNRWLVGEGLLHVASSDVIGLVVETGCSFFAPVAFPGAVEVGVRVGRVGSSSVRYEVGVFAEGADAAVAQGHFVHVYVDRCARKPLPLSAEMRGRLGNLRITEI